MTKRRALITAAELTDKLQANPDFLARQREREQAFAERVARNRAEEAPLLLELRSVGLEIQALSDLVNTSAKYDAAIPILLRHLLLPYSDSMREFIARSLAVPEARQAWPTLIAEYRKASMGVGDNGFRLGAKDGLACALSAAATEAMMEELVALAKDRTNGSSRLLLLSALKKSKSSIVKQALEELASDPDLKMEIASWHRGKR